MIMRSIIGTIALVAIFANAQVANAAICYHKIGSLCTSDGKSGWDSKCNFRCSIGYRDGHEVVKLYKHGRWQVHRSDCIGSPNHTSPTKMVAPLLTYLTYAVFLWQLRRADGGHPMRV